MRDVIDSELNALVCDEVGKIDGALDDLLASTSDRIDDIFRIEDGTMDNVDDEVDPLSAERDADVPTDGEGLPMWIDFVEMRDLVREWTGMESLDRLAQTIAGDGGVSDIVNAFLRGGGILDEDGLLIVDPFVVIDSGSSSSFLEFRDMFTRTTLSVTSVSVGGLDSLLPNGTSVLDPVGKYTLRNSFMFDRLAFALDVRAEIRPSSESTPADDDDDSSVVREYFTIEIAMRDVLVDFSIFIGANNGTLGRMPLGSIVGFENVLPCVFTVVDEAEITEVVVTASEVESPTLYGLDDAIGGTGYLITAVADALFDMYGRVLSGALPSVLSAAVKDVAADYIRMDDDACPKPDASLTGLVDYRDLLLSEKDAVEFMGRGGSPYGELFRYLYDYVSRILSAVDEDGMSRLNEFIVTLMDLESNDEGGIVLAVDFFKRNLDISLNGLNAVVEIAISNVTVSNLDSIGVLKLAIPMMGESSVLDNEASVGVGPDPIRLSFTLLVKGKVDQMEFDNEVEVGVSIVDLDMALQVLAQMKELSLMNFLLDDVTDLNCWLSTIVTPVLDKFGIRVGEHDSGLVLGNLAMAVGEARLDMKCIHCTDAVVMEIKQLMQSGEGIADATDTINKILVYGSDILRGDYVQNGIDRMLSNATYNCPHSALYQHDFPGLVFQDMPVVKNDAPSYGFLFAIISVIAVVAVSATVVFFVTRLLSMRRHKLWMSTLNQDQIKELDRLEREERVLEKDLDQRIKSLFTSREIPCFIRYLLPIVILGNVALFLSGHLSLGGTVNISGSVGEQEFEVVGFYEFSMVNSMQEMWNANAHGLAVCLALFSGIWPYTKLLFTLFLWFTPTRWISSKRRGSILRWLDILGKWSIIDVFVLLMTLVSFGISVSSPDLAFLPQGLYSINMMVVPLWGLYANMLAQLVSQVSSHFINHYHRKSVMTANKSQQVELQLDPPSNDEITLEKLGAHTFKLDYEASSKRASVRRSVGLILIGAFILFSSLVICGCSLPSFSIEIFGLVGLAVESGNKFEEAKTYYSVFDLANMIMEQGRYLNTASDLVGFGTLASLLVITVFIVPLAQTASLLAEWFTPMTANQRLKNEAVNEILSSWQYMEVYALAIIITAWQIGDVSEFLLNAYCGSLEETFTSLSYFGILDNEDAQCFRVDATVETASWILVAASLMLCILNHFIRSASRQKKQDDSIPAKRRRHTDMFLQSNLAHLSQSTEWATTSGSDDYKEEAAKSVNRATSVGVSQISPRFTDYYYFAMTHQTNIQKSADDESECNETCLNSL